MQIAYEPHPVTPQRKAELVAQGFKIIDARFAPQKQAEPFDSRSIAKMKRAELVDLLEAHGADTSGKVADLRARLTETMFVRL